MVKILVIDDEEDILASLEMLIETMGFEVKTVNRGAKGIDLLKKEKFDLVLLDMLMPELSGKEVLNKIREDPKTKSQKVAFLTVVKLSETGKKVIAELKPVDYFEKPINVPAFKKRLKELLKEVSIEIKMEF